jgi:hypothetical protein
MENTFELLKDLREKFEKSNSRNKVIELEPAISIETIKEVENNINFRFPPDFTDYLTNHGRFEIGEPEHADHLSFKILPLNEFKTASELLKEELEVSSNEEIADELGLSVEHINELDKIIVFGLLGHEDYYGFDTRSQNSETLDCSCTLVLFEDLEIEHLAKKTKKATINGFDELVGKLISKENWE